MGVSGVGFRGLGLGVSGFIGVKGLRVALRWVWGFRVSGCGFGVFGV